jgi:hypothetical protein
MLWLYAGMFAVGVAASELTHARTVLHSLAMGVSTAAAVSLFIGWVGRRVARHRGKPLR